MLLAVMLVIVLGFLAFVVVIMVTVTFVLLFDNDGKQHMWTIIL